MTTRLLRLLGLLLMLSAAVATLSRAPDRAPETLVARWALPPSDFIEVRGQLVHLRDEGPRSDPAPLLLLHGTAASLHTWDGWAAALVRSGRRVIRIDLPGFGLTGPFAGEYPADDYRGDSYARFVLDLLDALALSRVAIGGNSLGGEVAWRAATLRPERFVKLILVDASGYDFEPEAVPIGFVFARLPPTRWIGQHLLPRAVVAASLRAVYADPARVTEALVDRYFELALREGNRRALGLRLQQLEPGRDAARIKSLALPTLVLWGEQDLLLPPSHAQRFATDIRGARKVILPGLGHVPQEEDPARSVNAVIDFLSESKPP